MRVGERACKNDCNERTHDGQSYSKDRSTSSLGGNSQTISLTTSFAFLSLSPMKRECRRRPPGVHWVNSNCATSRGFSQRQSCIFSLVSPSPHRPLFISGKFTNGHSA